jgi:hypothetical protein
VKRNSGTIDLAPHYAAQQFKRPEMSLRVISVIFAVWPDVGSFPNSDRDNDMPGGRYVPLSAVEQNWPFGRLVGGHLHGRHSI